MYLLWIRAAALPPGSVTPTAAGSGWGEEEWGAVAVAERTRRTAEGSPSGRSPSGRSRTAEGAPAGGVGRRARIVQRQKRHPLLAGVHPPPHGGGGSPPPPPPPQSRRPRGARGDIRLLWGWKTPRLAIALPPLSALPPAPPTPTHPRVVGAVRPTVRGANHPPTFGPLLPREGRRPSTRKRRALAGGLTRRPTPAQAVGRG